MKNNNKKAATMEKQQQKPQQRICYSNSLELVQFWSPCHLVAVLPCCRHHTIRLRSSLSTGGAVNWVRVGDSTEVLLGLHAGGVGQGVMRHV